MPAGPLQVQGGILPQWYEDASSSSRDMEGTAQGP